MNNKPLNPPYIENILPPFFESSIIIPFEPNRSVNMENEVNKKNAYIILKDSLSNEVVYSHGGGLIDISKKTVTFNFLDKTLDKKIFSIGKYYKVQIAFSRLEAEPDLYYSSIGLSKYIGKKPEISLLNNQEQKNITGAYQYIGTCKTDDPTEKVCSYSFSLKNLKTNEIIYSTGEKIHNSDEDNGSTSVDICYLPIDIDVENKYELTYSITTISGFIDSTSKILFPQLTVNISLGNNVLIAEPDEENGTIIIKIQKKDINKDFTPIPYNFILLRASSKDNFDTWNRIFQIDEDNSNGLFDLQNSLLINNNSILWEDNTIEHGVSYKYALQAYNSYGLLSKKVEANIQSVYDENGELKYTPLPVQVNFEDMYLSDGERQLRIRFNPKVSSFKNTILETKVDTIGSQYPFFFRNGTVKYKEFPISGLISLLMDPDDKFKVGLYNVQKKIGTSLLNGTKTDLIYENIKNEKDFKLTVLEWLNNGKPKIFRSATEGNYLVRLMNVSLSPNDTLGRMLHTFSCTAYEIDDYNFETLQKYDLINYEAKKYKLDSFFGEQNIKLSQQLENNIVISLPSSTFWVTIQETKPSNAIYKIIFKDNSTMDLRIGQNGIYEFPKNLKNNVIGISWSNWNQLKNEYLLNPEEKNDINFKVRYGYYDVVNLTNFSFIKNITYRSIITQHIGEFNFKDSMNFNNWNVNDDSVDSPISTLATWGIREIQKIHFIKIKRRPLIPLYYNNNNYYFNKNFTDLFSLENEKFLIQGLYVLEPNENGISEIWDFANYEAYESEKIKPKILSSDQKDLFNYKLNGEEFSLNLNNLSGNLHNINERYAFTSFELNINNLEMVPDELILNSGLMMEIAFLAKDFSYDLDQLLPYDKNNLEALKKSYEMHKAEWMSTDNQASVKTYLISKKKYKDKYKTYIKAMIKIIQDMQKNQEVNVYELS